MWYLLFVSHLQFYQVYDRLMMAAGDKQVLPFSVLAILATAPDGSLVDGKIKSLIRLLRPDVSARGIAYRTRNCFCFY